VEDEAGALVRHDTDAYAAVELALDSVVKVFTVSSSPNYFLPWQNKAQRESMGSGKALISARVVVLYCSAFGLYLCYISRWFYV